MFPCHPTRKKSEFKDCFVQYSINDEGELSVNVERNIEASSLGSTITEVSINRTKYYRIDTNILLKDIAEETVQVSQIVSLEDVGQAFIQTAQGMLVICVRAVPGKVNLSFKAPLVAKVVNIQMVQE